MKFPSQDHWSGLPFPSSVDLPDPGIEPQSPALQADSLPAELRGKPIGLITSQILQAFLMSDDINECEFYIV